MKTIDLISGMEKNTFFNDDRDYRTRALDTLISRIRLSKKDKFVGMRTPAWVKNKYGKGEKET